MVKLISLGYISTEGPQSQQDSNKPHQNVCGWGCGLSKDTVILHDGGSGKVVQDY